jgi:hypothetical protein
MRIDFVMRVDCIIQKRKKGKGKWKNSNFNSRDKGGIDLVLDDL